MTVIPHLYDLTADSTGMLALSGIGGNMVVLSWLYGRGSRWTLDRNNIRGKEGTTLLVEESDEDEEELEAEKAADDKTRVIETRESAQPPHLLHRSASARQGPALPRRDQADLCRQRRGGSGPQS